MKVTIGRSDKADFPELSLLDIDLKVDSSAYTSSIHFTNIQEIILKDELHFQFTLLGPTHPLFNNTVFKTKNIIQKL